jgi:hypothetical protein
VREAAKNPRVFSLSNPARMPSFSFSFRSAKHYHWNNFYYNFSLSRQPSPDPPRRTRDSFSTATDTKCYDLTTQRKQWAHSLLVVGPSDISYESQAPDVDTGNHPEGEATLRKTRSGRCDSSRGSCPLADVSPPRRLMRSTRHDVRLAITCAGVRLTYKSVELSTSLSAPWKDKSSLPG